MCYIIDKQKTFIFIFFFNYFSKCLFSSQTLLEKEKEGEGEKNEDEVDDEEEIYNEEDELEDVCDFIFLEHFRCSDETLWV